MEEDLREVLKKAVLAEQYGAGAVGGKMKKSKKPKKAKAKAGVSNLSMLGPVSDYGDQHKLQSLVKQMIKEEIAQGAGAVGGASRMPAKTVKKKKQKAGGPVGGFIGKHPMDYGGSSCCDHCDHCGGLLAGGPVGGEYEERCKMVRKKAKPMKQLFPYHAAQKAMAGIKFTNKTKRYMEIDDLAKSTFDPKLSVAKNAKRMREYFIQHRLPDLIADNWIKLRPE